MGKKVCKTCGSDKIIEKVWHDVNSGELIDICEEYWCRDCEDYTEICDEDEYSEHKEH